MIEHPAFILFMLIGVPLLLFAVIAIILFLCGATGGRNYLGDFLSSFGSSNNDIEDEVAESLSERAQRMIKEAKSKEVKSAEPTELTRKERQWYYYVDGQTMGPITETELRAMIAEGTLTTETLVWDGYAADGGSGQWREVRNAYRSIRETSLPASRPLLPTKLTPAKTPIAKASNSSSASASEETSLRLHTPTEGTWEISLTFQRSKSKLFDQALFLAQKAPSYVLSEFNGVPIHKATYSSSAKDYLAFIQLYGLVAGWKSSHVFINGAMIDGKIMGKLNYCYGDKCRSGNPDFCYGASFMTENPFGCHRLQISASNHPWYSFIIEDKSGYIINKNAIKERIDSYASVYSICPSFSYERIMTALDALPSMLSFHQYKKLAMSNSISYEIKITLSD